MLFVEEYDYYKVIYKLYKRICEVMQDKEQRKRLRQVYKVDLRVFDEQEMFLGLSKIMIDYQNSDTDHQYIILSQPDPAQAGQLNRYFLEKPYYIDHRRVKNQEKVKRKGAIKSEAEIMQPIKKKSLMVSTPHLKCPS